MAENSYTLQFDELGTTTLLNWRNKGKMYDNIMLSNPTIWFIMEKMKKKQQGGREIIINLRYGKNTTVKSYSRYDILDHTPQDNETAANYAWRQLAGAVVIDGFSEMINTGKSELVNLLDTKMRDLEDSMSEDLNKQIWRVTPGTKDVLSVPAIVVPYGATYDASTPGGLDGTTKTWWQNRKKESSALTWKALKAEMYNLYNTCSVGGAMGKRGFPDLAICNQATFEHLENYMDEKERYIDGDIGSKARTFGFENIKIKKATCFFDEMVPDAYGDTSTIAYDSIAIDPGSSWTYGSLYYINTEFLEYVVHANRDLAPQPFRRAESQDARIADIFHMHNLCVSNRRKHGVLTKIDTSLAA